MKIITKADLLDILKANDLPHSYKSLLKYEQMGVLPRPKNNTGFGATNASMRIYSPEEIQEAIDKLRAYKMQGKLPVEN